MQVVPGLKAPMLRRAIVGFVDDVPRLILRSARTSRAPFGASPNGRTFDRGIVVLWCGHPCLRRGAANSTRGRVRSPDRLCDATHELGHGLIEPDEAPDEIAIPAYLRF